jgi:hypothetical protein
LTPRIIRLREFANICIFDAAPLGDLRIGRVGAPYAGLRMTEFAARERLALQWMHEGGELLAARLLQIFHKRFEGRFVPECDVCAAALSARERDRGLDFDDAEVGWIIKDTTTGCR